METFLDILIINRTGLYLKHWLLDIAMFKISIGKKKQSSYEHCYIYWLIGLIDVFIVLAAQALGSCLIGVCEQKHCIAYIDLGDTVAYRIEWM